MVKEVLKVRSKQYHSAKKGTHMPPIRIKHFLSHMPDAAAEKWKPFAEKVCWRPHCGHDVLTVSLFPADKHRAPPAPSPAVLGAE